jgi:hypothetical protein
MNSPLIPKLNALRRKHAAVAAGTAAVAAVGLAVLCLAGGMLLDRWMDLPYTARAALLIVDGITLVAMLVWRGLWPVVRGPDVEQAALWVEQAVPAFGSRLISAVQFIRHPVAAGTSPAMVLALVQQTEAAAADVDFAAVVPVRPLRRLANVCAGVIVVVGIGFAWGGRTSLALAERALLRPVPFPHRTHVTVVTGDVTVARGDPVTLSAVAAGRVPSDGRVSVRYGSGATAELPATANGDHFDRAIENVQEPFVYRFTIGDDESAEYRVRTAERPAVQAVRCLVTPPAYTGLPPGARSPWDLSVPAGSELGLVVMANVPSAGTVHFAGANVDVPMTHGLVLLMPDAAIPAGATGFSVELTSADGLRSRDPVVYKIETVPDRPPTVRLTTPAGDGSVTPVARPTVVVEADDDYAVARTSLRYRITKAGQTVAAEDDPNGLTGTYGAGVGVTRVDPEVDLDWAATPPPAGVDFTQAIPVKWVGSVRPAVSDVYWFDVTCTGGGQLTVAGQPAARRSIPLQAGRLYPIVLTATAVPGGTARLSWRGRRVASQVVPHACLYRRTDPYEAPPDADGLVGYWPMDDVEAGFVRDAAGSADGTVFDAGRTAGRIGQAIAFRPVRNRGGGPGQHVELAESLATQYRADESYTLAAWARPEGATGQWQGIVTQGRNGGQWTGIGIGPGGMFVAASPGGDLVGPPATPQWHHLAIVQDGAARLRTLYVDGAAAVSGPSRDAAAGPMWFGDVRGGGQPFDGDLDDVRLYGRAIPADQVRAMFADPRPVHVPTPAEVGGLPGGAAGTVDLPGAPAPHVQRRLAWDLSALPSPPAVGDTIELWAEAADGNTITGPGTAASEHRHLRVVNAEEKRRELMGRLDECLGQIKDVTDDQQELTKQVGTMVGPTTGPAAGRQE